VATFREHRNEYLGLIKYGEFLGQLLLKRHFVL